MIRFSRFSREKITIKGTLEGENETIVWNFAHQAMDADGQPVGDPVNLTASLTLVGEN